MPEPRTGAPLLTVQQGNKESTVNEAISILAALGVGSVKSTLSTPPVAVEGNLYIIPATPAATAAWAGKENYLALAQANAVGGWKFFAPVTGWIFPVDSLGGAFLRFDGTTWVGKGAIESVAAATTAVTLTNGSLIPFPAATGSSGLAVSGSAVTHPTGTFRVSVGITLSGSTGGGVGSCEIWIKAGAYQRMVGTLNFTATTSTETVSASLVLTALAADNITVTIENIVAVTSLNEVIGGTWIQVNEV